MKFAKELEEDLVPEWRVKYINYKVGKKKVKAISKALRNANKTPKPDHQPGLSREASAEHLPYTHYDFNRRSDAQNQHDRSTPPLAPNSHQDSSRPVHYGRRASITVFALSPPTIALERDSDVSDSTSPERTPEPTPERKPLQTRYSNDQKKKITNYGSISPSPQKDDRAPNSLSNFNLPDPAISPSQSRNSSGINQARVTTADNHRGTRPHEEESPDPYHVGRPKSARKDSLPKQIMNHVKKYGFPQSKTNTLPGSKLRRMFTANDLESPDVSNTQLEAYKQLDAKQDDFFNFLDKELVKIETFYKTKEDEATERLQVIRDQLHELRDRRLRDIQNAKEGHAVADEGIFDGLLPVTSLPSMPIKEVPQANGHGGFMKPIKNMLQGEPKIGKTSKSMQQLGSPTGPRAQSEEGGKDFVKKKKRHGHTNEVPYRYAKRRLKLALQEFYRGLELLKSYALLNRTGFRKINKKYDKAVNARPTGLYMSQKVNHAYFVQSNIIEGHLVAVEDLYARYFERGNHKIAVNKLRSKLRSGEQSAVTFRNGLFLAAGACFAVSGLVNAIDALFHSEATRRVYTSYLLQFYGGYFLALLLFLLFVLDCKIWTMAKVNYVFVFEYDARHVLDWRELAEIPCFFLLLNGMFLWLNFRQGPGDSVDELFLYYPVILIGITLVIMALPVKALYYSARKWWGFSNWRLLLAGLYPVEFRDFFLGDMYCSQTYAMSQIEVFFCLYANSWNDPPQCNSNHSRILGFLTTLPAIWRALQCLRRYYDSKNWFPHLANFAKYCCNILYYMTLSMYRIHMTGRMRAIMVVFAAINGIYCSIWDVLFDFSLGNPYAKHPFLRDRLAFREVRVYYIAIVVDVVLRHQWIFFALFAHDLQHSAFLSFGVALLEVLRRGMWSVFRVENEHCNNVEQFRASRDIPLPYELGDGPTHKRKDDTKDKDDGSWNKDDSDEDGRQGDASGQGTGADLEQQRSNDSVAALSLRKRAQTPALRALHRVGTVIAAAHAQDFEKKRKLPSEIVDESAGMGSSGKSPALFGSKRKSTDSSEEDEDDDDDDDDVPGGPDGDSDDDQKRQERRRNSELKKPNGKRASGSRKDGKRKERNKSGPSMDLGDVAFAALTQSKSNREAESKRKADDADGEESEDDREGDIEWSSDVAKELDSGDEDNGKDNGKDSKNDKEREEEELAEMEQETEDTDTDPDLPEEDDENVERENDEDVGEADETISRAQVDGG